MRPVQLLVGALEQHNFALHHGITALTDTPPWGRAGIRHHRIQAALFEHQQVAVPGVVDELNLITRRRKNVANQPRQRAAIFALLINIRHPVAGPDPYNRVGLGA